MHGFKLGIKALVETGTNIKGQVYYSQVKSTCCVSQSVSLWALGHQLFGPDFFLTSRSTSLSDESFQLQDEHLGTSVIPEV